MTGCSGSRSCSASRSTPASSLLRGLSISADARPLRWGYFRLAPPLGLLFSLGLALLAAAAVLPVASVTDIGWRILFDMPAQPSVEQVSELIFQLKQAFDEFVVATLERRGRSVARARHRYRGERQRAVGVCQRALCGADRVGRAPGGAGPALSYLAASVRIIYIMENICILTSLLSTGIAQRSVSSTTSRASRTSPTRTGRAAARPSPSPSSD